MHCLDYPRSLDLEMICFYGQTHTITALCPRRASSCRGSGFMKVRISALDKKVVETLEAHKVSYELDNNGRVIRLALNGIEIDNTILEEVTQVTRLRNLSLGNSTITEDGLARIAGLQSLESLGLSRTNISDRGLEDLENLRNLRHLWLHNCKSVSISEIQELTRVLPGLVVYSEFRDAHVLRRECHGMSPTQSSC
jgi:hypothetical protein